MVIFDKPGGSKLGAEEVTALLDKANLNLSPEAVDDWSVLLGDFDNDVQSLLALEDYQPYPDLEAYPRCDIFVPRNVEESDKGGWATRCTVKAANPKSNVLAGLTVGVKDNIAVAGVRCLNGMDPLGAEWVPEVDATVVTRVLDAGAVINGKATAESACLEGTSDTSYTGLVHNPYADNYACGGSSSGSGRVVASGASDMALGCDQGGSVRMPAAMCGIVGLKPTWGLVPYSGILGHQGGIDHCGPMTKTVRDNALLLEVIAGPDDMDDRQPRSIPADQLAFSSSLDSFLSTAPEKPLTGFRIGLLKEGFDLPMLNPNVDKAVRHAIDILGSLGAEVTEVSIPDHRAAGVAWTCTKALGVARDGLLGDRTGRKELYMTSRAPGPNAAVSQERFDDWGPGAQGLYLQYLLVNERYGPKLHAKATNLIRKYTRSYDAALESLDALVLPTVPFPATPSFVEGETPGPLERTMRNRGVLANTAQFDTTGHPALSVPVGFVPAAEDASIKLPTGLQIVGKQFDDLTCYKIGAAWEKAKDWKTLTYGL